MSNGTVRRLVTLRVSSVVTLPDSSTPADSIGAAVQQLLDGLERGNDDGVALKGISIVDVKEADQTIG